MSEMHNKQVTKITVGRTLIMFGQNSLIYIPAELTNLGVKKPMLVTDGTLAKLGILRRVTELFKQAGIDFVLFDEVMPDPVSSIVDSATNKLKMNHCDGVIGLGGGSVMDVAKCVAAMAANPGKLLDYDHSNKNYAEFEQVCLPLINIPTTAGTGSELSQYAVITNEIEKRKATIGSPKLLSNAVIVDPTLVKGLPPRPTAACGCDALAHCIESVASVKSIQSQNLIIDSLALNAIELIYRYLPRAVSDGEDMEAREKVSWAATMGGIVLQYGSGAAHGLGNVLGGTYHVPHGYAIGMLLPHVLRFNLPSCEERYQLVAKQLGFATSAETVEAVAAMVEALPLPRLREYVPESDLPRLAQMSLKDKCTQLNGKPVAESDALSIYQKAF